jgi:hypothetical protein
MLTVPDIRYCGRFAAIIASSPPNPPAVCISIPDVQHNATHLIVVPDRAEWLGLDAAMQLNLIHGVLLSSGVRRIHHLTWSLI